jgi:hypothetical protein
MPLRLSELVITGASSVVAPPLTALGASPAEGIVPTVWSGRPPRLPRMDRLCALGLVAADGAVLDAKLSPETLEGDRTAVVFGTAFGCHATNEAYYRDLLKEGPKAASPRLFAYTLPSSPVGEICIHYRITGPASTHAGALTSGLEALIEGQRLVRLGSIDRVLVVTADVATPWLMKILDRTDLEDSAAALVLERRDVALARGHGSSARLLGFGAAFSPKLAKKNVAVEESFAMAEWAPADVTRLYASSEQASELGVSTRAQGDYRAELLASAPLYHLGHFLHHETGTALVSVRDPEGAAVAALVECSASARPGQLG